MSRCSQGEPELFLEHGRKEHPLHRVDAPLEKIHLNRDHQVIQQDLYIDIGLCAISTEF